MESSPALGRVICDAEPFAWNPINSRGSALRQDFLSGPLLCVARIEQSVMLTLHPVVVRKEPLPSEQGFVNGFVTIFFFSQAVNPPSATLCIDPDNQQQASCRKASSGIIFIWIFFFYTPRPPSAPAGNNKDCSREMAQHHIGDDESDCGPQALV